MIRWINDTLGTAPWESAVKVSGVVLLDVRDMVDKEGNSPGLIQSKIEQGVKIIENGGKVIVCCDYGISRSNAVAAGIMAIQRSIPFHCSLQLLIERTAEKAIKLEMMHCVADVVRHMQNGTKIKMKPQSPHVVVTGGSGYLGSALTSCLQTKYSTISLNSSDTDLVAGAVDLDLKVQQHDASHIVHLAASRDFGRNSAVGDSVSMLKNVLDVCSANNLKLVFVSSADVFSNYTTKQLRATELLAPSPRNSPGITKYLCEILIQQHAAVHRLDWTILRSATVYGGKARRPKFLHTFIEKSLQGDAITVHRYRNGNPEVDLLHIDDFCRAVITAIDSEYSGLVHCGSGTGHTTRALVDMIQDIVGSNCKVSDHLIDTDTPNVILDCSLAATKLRWLPQISLYDGIRKIVKSMSIQALNT